MQMSSLVESAVSPNFAARQKSNYILAKKQPCCLENSVIICKCWHTLNSAFFCVVDQRIRPKYRLAENEEFCDTTERHLWTQPLANYE